jgi:type VI secretion system secreted protein Hcp
MARSDMFFKASGQKTGPIKGSTSDKAFADQIDVVDWSWGMTAPTAVSGQRAGSVALSHLKLVKRVDKATTALMSVMRMNELLTLAELSVRKPGATGQDTYFKVKLEKARITAYHVESDIDDAGVPTLTERLELTFVSGSFEYQPGGFNAVIDAPQ